jgi:hypothetical protein
MTLLRTLDENDHRKLKIPNAKNMIAIITYLLRFENRILTLKGNKTATEAIDKTEPREVLDYRIMLFLGFSLLVIVPVSILLILTPVINITLRKQVLNRKNLTKSGKHDKNVLKDTTVFMTHEDIILPVRKNQNNSL